MNQKKQQQGFNINGRDFLPLILAEYPILFDLLDLKLNPQNPVGDIPINLLQKILELVQSKCVDDITEISPVELLSTAYLYISYHIELMSECKRILSFDEQQKIRQEKHIVELQAAGMMDEALKLEQALYQEQMQMQVNNRSFNRQIKELQASSGKNELHILQWAMSVSQSDVTSLSVSELMQMSWVDFISLSNQAQILSNLQQAAHEDARRQAQFESKQQQQHRF